jgi:hypothetical protein
MLAPMVAVRGINRNLDPQPGHSSTELHLLSRHFTWSSGARRGPIISRHRAVASVLGHSTYEV